MNRIDQDQNSEAANASAFWRHPRFDEMSLLKARFTRHRYALHTHETYVIALITQGCEKLRVGRRRDIAPAGTIILVNPEECHDGEAGAEDGWAYRVFYPPVALMTEVATELGLGEAPLFHRSCIDDPELAAAILAAHQVAESGNAADAEALLLAALERLILGYGDRRARSTSDRSSGAKQRLPIYERLVDEEMSNPLTLAEFARAAGVNRFQVIRDFKWLTGLTPGSYIRNHRIREASRLIAKGADLAGAAAAAGFADQSHLTRVFRGIVGVTPGEFRAGIVDGKDPRS
ncbi:AraC-type DNA-binding protein [Rhizobiales bacterium GAS191]|nr:AraC-type DNA-binding protein [Rhizobiales bacterium GAS191]SEE73292.1 AraC-type DNA-binding protein [Rhizobiales bacterium GAS188]